MLPYRILRAAKNRYGSTNELGMFDMTGQGLAEIENPSQMLLEGRPLGVSGNCVACTMEGSRPILSVQGISLEIWMYISTSWAALHCVILPVIFLSA